MHNHQLRKWLLGKTWFALPMLILIFSDMSNACNPYFNETHFDVTKQQFVDESNAQGLSRQQYDWVLNKIFWLYDPLVRARGANLQIVREWNNPAVNAFARRWGRQWRIHMLGGYARHRLATVDALIMLACHEMGHHLGGTPLYTLASWRWASTEGQADYFANLKCLRHMMASDDNESIVKAMRIPVSVVRACQRSFPKQQDQWICQRGAMAAYRMNQIWENGAGTFRFETPDLQMVRITQQSHPRPQCRIDTSFAGATCPVSSLIFPNEFNPLVGTCNRVQGFQFGVRPLCWYRP